MKITKKLFIFVIFVGLLIGIGSLAFLSTAEQALQNQIIKEVQFLTKETLMEVDRGVYSRIEEIQGYAADILLKNQLIESNNSFDQKPDRDEYIKNLNEIWKSKKQHHEIDEILNNDLSMVLKGKIKFLQKIYGHSVFGELFVTNKYGAIVGAYPRTTKFYQAGKEWFVHAKSGKGLLVNDIEYDESSKTYSLEVMVNIYDSDGEFIGILEGALNTDGIKAVIDELQTKSQYPGLESYLVNKDGFVIFSGLDPVVKNLGRDIRLKEYGTTLPLPDFFDAELEKGAFGSLYDENITKLLTYSFSQGYKGYSGLGWKLITYIDKDRVFGPVRAFREGFITIFLFVVLIGIFICIFLYRSIFRPLEKIQSATENIGKGIWDSDLNVHSQDEMGNLARAIREMADSRRQAEEHIKSANEDLERRVSERSIELKKSETSLINVISNLDGMVYHCKNDKDWTMDFVSSGCLALTGYKPEEIERNNTISFNTIIHPDDREAVWDNVQEALKIKVPFILNYRITTSEGELKYVWEQGRGVWSNSGELEGLQGFITDITKQVDAEQQVKKSQTQLIHMEKLSALGKLTGSIAHEFNNPLQGIRSTIASLSKSTLSDKEVKLANAGKKECDRMAKMIRGLRDFYRPTSGKVSSIDINQCIEELVTLQIKSMQEKGIQVNQQFSDNLPKIEVVEDQIKQVILNLIQNAADSISGEGQITLTTEKQDSHLKIKIQDTGCGISADDKKNLFEPFYTTRNAEQGTGLGLSISHGIIHDHGGNIGVKSELDEGTTFTVSLPIK
jgi:PAS domain S-box-containing protein